jgi:hypothetical protein
VTQKGFMKDRFMSENTRLLYDLMHYLEENDMVGLLLVDFEKAFDSIEWKFLRKALNSFNFGPSICKWFETFYVDSKSCVINNGHTCISNFFNLERGCHQGNPLSPYLFIRPKKNICVFTVTCQKNLGSIGQDYFFFSLIIDKTGNSCSRFRNPIFHFRDFR